MNKQFKNMKIRIKDEEHSRAVQEVLFDLGYSWVYGAKLLSFPTEYIYTYSNGNITQDRGAYNEFENDAVEHFSNHKNTEVTLEDLQAMLKQDTDVENTGLSCEHTDKFDALMTLMLECDCCITLCDEYYSVYDKWDNETKYHSYEDLIAGLVVIKKYKDLVDSV
jgi:hypothetical protein